MNAISRSAELASRFVDVANLPWEKTRFPGIEQKTLLIDKRDRPDHRADEAWRRARACPTTSTCKIEQTYVLEGSLHLRRGRMQGRRSSSGARPAAATKPGPGRRAACSSAMFQIPNKFFQRDGRATDFRGNDWEKSWGHA